MELSDSGLSVRELVSYLLPYFLIIPAVTLIVFVMVYPALWSIYISFYDIKLYSIFNWKFIGVNNYVELLKDPIHILSWLHTPVFVGGSVAGQFLLGMFMAAALNAVAIRGKEIFRAIFLLPHALSGVIIAYSWRFMYDPYMGLANYFLRLLGLKGVAWLSKDFALYSCTIANIWRGTATSFIIQTAGFASIERTLYESAEIDGAGVIQRFIYITLPMLKPFILVNLILITMATFNTFDMVYVLTGGGPLYASMVPSIYMYKSAFEFGLLGYGASLSVILFAVNLTFTLVYLRSIRGGI